MTATLARDLIKPILLHSDGIRDLCVGRQASHRVDGDLIIEDNGNGKFTRWRKSRGTTNVTIEEVWKKLPDGSCTLQGVTEVVQPVKEWLMEFCPFKIGQSLRVKEAIGFRGPSYTPYYMEDGTVIDEPDLVDKLQAARLGRRVIPAKKMPAYAARFIVRITNIVVLEDVCDRVIRGDRWKWGLTVEVTG